jgi:succinate dehydrogenase / fumarate reductase cytochrome b subunit
MAETLKQRPVYRNIGIQQITRYRLPMAGWVSILHRISGFLMIVLLPFAIWMFDTSLTSEISYGEFTSVFNAGAGPLPAWFIKLVALALIWAYLMHFCAGLRHLWMDATHSVQLAFGRRSAVTAIAISLVLTIALGIKLFS